MSDATASYGTQFQVGDGGGPEVFTAVAEVKSIGGFEISANTEEVTHMLSTRRFREFVKTVLEMGDIDLTVNWLPANATQDATTGMVSLLEDFGITNFKIVWPDAANTEWIIPGFATGFASDQEFDGASEADFTITPTGAPTLT